MRRTSFDSRSNGGAGRPAGAKTVGREDFRLLNVQKGINVQKEIPLRDRKEPSGWDERQLGNSLMLETLSLETLEQE